MKITIVGCGKVGATLAEQLSEEDHDITIIDINENALRPVVDQLDILGIHGNGASLSILKEAGTDEADLLIAVTTADELNLLACLVAKKVGAKNTIARVRHPEYTNFMHLIKDDLGLSLTINPEFSCAMEIARVLRFPSMIQVDTFAHGRVELLQFEVPEDSYITGHSLKELFPVEKKILICVAEHHGSDEVIIPNGDYVIEARDKLSIVGEPHHEAEFMKSIGIRTNRIKSLMIVGGGKIAYYLANQLLAMNVRVKIIEQNPERCQELATKLPDADIILADGTDQAVLIEEGLKDVDAFATLTGLDEENIMTSLFARRRSDAKLITKITRNPFLEITSSLDLGSVFNPRMVAAEHILRYVRAMQNSYGSNVETLCKIIDDRAEALEFYIDTSCPLIGIPIMNLKIRTNALIAVINRHNRIIIPGGRDDIRPGDTVIIVTTESGVDDLEDIILQ